MLENDPAANVEAEMNADRIAAMSAKALGLNHGVNQVEDLLELGGEQFVMGYVTIDTEQKLLQLVHGAFRTSKAQNLHEALLESNYLLVRGAAICLADRQYRGNGLGAITEDDIQAQEDWLRSRHGADRVTTVRLINFVIGQCNEQEIAQCLGKLLMPVALAGLLKMLGLHLPETSAQPSSSSGPAEATDAAPPS